MNTGINNNLAAIRKRRGIPASELAHLAGVTRQTVYAVEAGTYVPNTAVGLRLARALDVAFEELFSLSETAAEPHEVSLPPDAGALDAGQPVQLCRIDGKLFGAPFSPARSFLPASDGSLAGNADARGKAKVFLNNAAETYENRLLLAGCDPAMSVLARAMRPAGIELLLLHRNSSESLSLLKRGCVHMAGTHLREETPGQSKLTAINKVFAKKDVAVVSFAIWEEGLVTAARNPKQIKGVHDLLRKDVTLVNREPGSGSRTHLDSLLKRHRLSAKSISGYARTVPGHLAAAWEVKAGTADCCIATQAAARVFGLDFTPLESVRYDLALRQSHLNLPGVQLLFDTLHRADFRRKLENAGGYQTSVTGERLR